MHRLAQLAVVPLLLAGAASAAETAVPAMPKKSPFELRGANAPQGPAANETIEFAGVSSIGKKTDLIFYDKSSKKSHWIAQGETKEGISVVSYDERRDSVVVKINGVEKTLALRKGAGPVNTPRPVTPLPGGFNTPLPPAMPAPVSANLPVPTGPNPNPVPPAAGTETTAQATPPPAPGSPAEVQKRQETEARMLVSDLLEIGMAQRKAYEEAQRRAAEGTPQAPQNATPDPNQPAQPAR
jgi:hypothetical protein